MGVNVFRELAATFCILLERRPLDHGEAGRGTRKRAALLGAVQPGLAADATDGRGPRVIAAYYRSRLFDVGTGNDHTN